MTSRQGQTSLDNSFQAEMAIAMHLKQVSSDWDRLLESRFVQF